MNELVNIGDIIQNKEIITYFQPIVSVRQRSIIGFEALTRGIDNKTGRIIPPNQLFSLAEVEDKTVELDRLCREKALCSFKDLSVDNELFLAINFKTSIIDKGVVGSGNLLNQVLDCSLKPGKIIIEIVESEVKDLSALTQFVRNYKNLGYLIALDDFGSGYSNMDRVAVIRPDIIKIDRSLIREINREYYKQEILKSLVRLSHKLGALVLAEGVENEQEALILLELGVDMFQGYYFSKPVLIDDLCIECCQGLIDQIGIDFRTVLVRKGKEQKIQRKKFNSMVNDIITVLTKTNGTDFDRKLMELLNIHPSLECLYILDESGIQVSDTIFDNSKLSNEKRSIFNPARKGTDQSYKEYYMMIQTGIRTFVTEPYISLASGNLCVTISSLFNLQNQKYVICLDVQAL